MGLHRSSHPGLPDMKGLHLFHFMVSNCSQRVRFALEEKGLPWESHHVSIPAREHLTDEYQSLNPNGVVPTLVHDGQVVIESNDILAYLDEHFPEPPLRPADPEERARMEQRVALASEAQASVKTLSHDLIFRALRKVDAEELADYDARAGSRELVAFLHDFAENGDAWRERARVARADMERRLDALEQGLSRDPWLSGSSFGLADVSWSVNIHRLVQAQVDLERWPRLRAWYEKLSARPAFDRAVVRWSPAA